MSFETVQIDAALFQLKNPIPISSMPSCMGSLFSNTKDRLATGKGILEFQDSLELVANATNGLEIAGVTKANLLTVETAKEQCEQWIAYFTREKKQQQNQLQRKVNIPLRVARLVYDEFKHENVSEEELYSNPEILESVSAADIYDFVIQKLEEDQAKITDAVSEQGDDQVQVELSALPLLGTIPVASLELDDKQKRKKIAHHANKLSTHAQDWIDHEWNKLVNDNHSLYTFKKRFRDQKLEILRETPLYLRRLAFTFSMMLEEVNPPQMDTIRSNREKTKAVLDSLIHGSVYHSQFREYGAMETYSELVTKRISAKLHDV